MPSPLKKSFAAEQLRRQQRKTPWPWITVGIVAVIVVIVVGYAVLSRYQVTVEQVTEETVPEPEQINSIAVLPFVDMSSEKDQEFLGEGLAEAILNALTNISELRVIARNSSFVFRGEYRDIRAIGDSLDVESVLEGSVLKSGNKIRVTAQLIMVSDNSHLFSRQYDYEWKDVFTLQDSISIAVVNALKVEILEKDKTAIERRYTENSEAYNLYLLGRYHWNKRNEEGLKAGLDYFQQAIDKDPDYAIAYVGIADSYNILGYWGFISPEDAFPEAKKFAEKALEIDDTLAEAHTSLAWVNLIYDWDWPAAERGFKQAISLNPNYATAHQWYWYYLLIMGRFNESFAEIKLAQKIDPLSLIIYFSMSQHYLFVGRYDEGIELCKKAIAINSNFGLIYNSMGLHYLNVGKNSEAMISFQKAIELIDGFPLAKGYIGYIHAISGEREIAEQILTELKELKRSKYIPSSTIALIYIGLNENDKVFEWYEKAYEEHDTVLSLILALPVTHELKSIRFDQRFKALQKKMGLE